MLYLGPPKKKSFHSGYFANLISAPVNYKRVAENDGKEVPWDQIVKGYEYEKGKFVVLQEEDFKRVDIEATQTVDIIHFVEVEEINPMFFQKPYYMEPQKGGG